MQMAQYTYAGLLLVTIALPLALSFDKKVRFYANWKYIFPAILASAAVFLTWDVRFTEAGIRSFNPDYVTGYSYLGLPIGEWLFFVCIPYAGLFIYEVLKTYLAKFEKANFFAAISLVLMVLFALVSYFSRSHLYTFFNFLFLAVYLGYIIFRNKFKHHLTTFYLTFFAGLIPFFIINSILTGLPVIVYHPDHILGIRLLNVPVIFSFCC
jgi:lycopene cyclase domain-containing protein